MGGCRCTFRRCPNNSANSPGMHFFHYPLKFKERLDLWTKYADTTGFLDLPLNKARNKVVCENHFRDECFMNYKKDRLVHQAVPTLVRLPNGMVLDYEESDNPEPKLLEPTKEKHLIPPKQSLKKSGGEFIVEILEEYKSTSSPNFLKKRLSETTLRECQSPKIMKIASNPKILNTEAKSSTLKPIPKFQAKIGGTKKVNPELSSTSREDLEIVMCKIEPMQNPSDEDSSAVDFTCNDANPENIPEIIEIREEENRVNPLNSEVVSRSTYEETISKYEKKIEELERKLKDKETAKVKNTQVEAVSTTRPSPGINPNLLTKSQLFSGIKKYLSPSMATFVRMEMFSGPERSWKPDEKQVSVELLRLGESVFNYFRDEWRFRLPPKKDVENWLSSYEIFEGEEDL